MAGLGRVSSSEETMAEILALGISHYPPLTGHDNRMARILRRMMQNPDLPGESPDAGGLARGDAH